MTKLKKAVAAATVTGALATLGVATTATPASAHPITCSWNKGWGTPWSVTSTAVKGFVQVKCSDRLDDANTRAQLQIYRDGAWRNQGTGVTSYSTAKTIHVNDSAPKRIGGYHYRTQGTHFGQHGNVWALPTYYSPSRYLVRNG
ncbi:hypothetical protein ACQEVG_31805 [Streptomyces sp. CA-135486]|uniref:hypothetical protein n=1 Tax=Streptomyces sp. CA-135486 TaxID=3240049 RepID=UPI003D8B1CE6